MECKLLDCDNEACMRVISPFGTANICAEHAVVALLYPTKFYYEASLVGEDAPEILMNGLREAFRYGHHSDPPLAEAERGERYVHPDGGGVA